MLQIRSILRSRNAQLAIKAKLTPGSSAVKAVEGKQGGLMVYIDTNFLVAYHFKEEERHQDAKSIMEELGRKDKQLSVYP
jgi:hypothetical protein